VFTDIRPLSGRLPGPLRQGGTVTPNPSRECWSGMQGASAVPFGVWFLT